MKTTLFLAFVLFSGTVAQAQTEIPENEPLGSAEKILSVPTTIDFQGRLSDSSGNPLNASLGITFSLYDVLSGGTALWTETLTVEVTDGLFQVKLGELAPFTPAHFSGTDRWLGIQVGTEAEMSPRTKLSSVGYALQSFETDPTWEGNANTSDAIGRTGNVGIGLTSPTALLHTRGTGTGEGNVVFVGEYKSTSPGAPPVSGAGTRIMWYPDKSAFRVGSAESNQWDQGNVGNFSIAMGYSTTASGFWSTAMGVWSDASGSSSIAMGAGSDASGPSSIAMGNRTTASGYSSTAMGYYTNASQRASTAMGDGTMASGDASTAMGKETMASGYNSTAMGNETTASGYYSTAMGYGTMASRDYSTAMGKETMASGYNSTAMGNETTASGYFCTAMGDSTKAYGEASTAMGYGTKAYGEASTAMGSLTTASGRYSTATGVGTNASAYGATAIGSYNVGGGNATSFVNTDPIFEIGIGQSSSERNNALTVLKNGNTGIGIHTPKAPLHVEDRIRVGEDPSYAAVYGELIHEGGSTGFRINANAGGGWADLHLQTDGNTRMFIESGGNVGIGTTTPGYKLTVNGTAWCSAGAWLGSDIRWKRDISPMSQVLPQVMDLQAVNYFLRTEEFPEMGFSNDPQIGLIAQEVEKIFPQLVSTDPNGFKSIAYDKLSVLLLEALKEQQGEIDELRQKDQQQKAENDQMNARLERLERALESLGER